MAKKVSKEREVLVVAMEKKATEEIQVQEVHAAATVKRASAETEVHVVAMARRVIRVAEVNKVKEEKRVNASQVAVLSQSFLLTSL